MGYTCKNYGIYSKNYGIYWAKTIGSFMGYIWQRLRDIFGKTMGYTGPLDIFCKH